MNSMAKCCMDLAFQMGFYVVKRSSSLISIFCKGQLKHFMEVAYLQADLFGYEEVVFIVVKNSLNDSHEMYMRCSIKAYYEILMQSSD